MGAVITGIGLISSIGLNTKDTWNAMVQGKSGVSKIESFDTEGIPVKIAGEIKKFNIEEYNIDSKYSKSDRSCQLALAAAKLAIEDAKLFDIDFKKYRVGVIIGNAAGSVITAKKVVESDINKEEINKDMARNYVREEAANIISDYFGFSGVSQIVSTGCTSGIDSIGLANSLIERDILDIVVCGGTEAPLNKIVVSAFAKINALSLRNDEPEKASRPYDKYRDGFVLAEGSGILVLESKKMVIESNRNAYAEILGYASNSNAFHMTGMPKDGILLGKVIEESLKDAGVTYKDIDYINSHGSSTKLNDYSETAAYKHVFKERAYEIPISSIKSMVGHSLGAIGGIEVGACAKMLKEQIILPTINFEERDEDCDLDYVFNKSRTVNNLNVIVSNASGFSGLNSSIVLKRWVEN